jgi:2-dehydropantoate 2-reductase
MLLAVGLRYRRMRSSMLAAIERGRTPAVDFLNGEVVDRARAHGLGAPFNTLAREMVWDIAKGKRTPGFDLVRELAGS